MFIVVFLITILVAMFYLSYSGNSPASYLKCLPAKFSWRMNPDFKALLVLVIFIGVQMTVSGCAIVVDSNQLRSDLEEAAQNPASSGAAVSEVASQTQHQLLVHFIDVGQADSILIQNGDHAMLIDAGNNDDADLVTQYLQKQGVKKIEYLIGTHPHEDHIGGMDGVINAFPIAQVILPHVTHTTKTFSDMVTAMKNKGYQATKPVVGDRYSLGDASFVILAPTAPEYEGLNNYSVVIKLSYGNTSFLFAGDAEKESEEEMIATGLDLSANLLKLGHHGSRSSTSAAFLQKVHPQYAVISVGKGNDYGHPHQETMKRLQSNGALVYRTDESGTIIATSDGQRITFNQNSGTYASAHQ
jgi:competence protein ComEC